MVAGQKYKGLMQRRERHCPVFRQVGRTESASGFVTAFDTQAAWDMIHMSAHWMPECGYPIILAVALFGRIFRSAFSSADIFLDGISTKG
jgi:hypothetical protein